jgi:Ribonuclease HI
MRVFFTDGSASPNPGPGGYAVIENGRPVALGSEDGQTTNIRMEGMALIAAMKLAGGEPCEIHSDSEFWINVLTKWAPGWAVKGWHKKGGEIKNLDIVQQAYELYRSVQPQLVWVRGHVGHEQNELADEWANKARTGIRL